MRKRIVITVFEDEQGPGATIETVDIEGIDCANLGMMYAKAIFAAKLAIDDVVSRLPTTEQRLAFLRGVKAGLQERDGDKTAFYDRGRLP